jgi:hypothetical protein
VPDLCLPVSGFNGWGETNFNGLYIEMKAGKNKPTESQKWWLDKLKKYGHKVAVCYSGEEAVNVICDYLGIQEKTV